MDSINDLKVQCMHHKNCLESLNEICWPYTALAFALDRNQDVNGYSMACSAYNLEVFEAQFYSCAATGSGIPSQYLGGGPAATGMSCT